MATFITALPTLKHDGSTTESEREITLSMLRNSGVKFSAVSNCYGIWIADDGRRYEDETVLVTMAGDEAAMRSALSYFGREAGQREVLFVQADGSHVLGYAQGLEAAAELAKKYGGATLLPDGTAVSFQYNALVAGVDYEMTELTMM